jgi:hypothetical protein
VSYVWHALRLTSDHHFITVAHKQGVIWPLAVRCPLPLPLPELLAASIHSVSSNRIWVISRFTTVSVRHHGAFIRRLTNGVHHQSVALLWASIGQRWRNVARLMRTISSRSVCKHRKT